MTKHGQHPTSIIRFPPRGERINNAPPASRCRVPRLRPPRPRAAGHFHTARASLQPTNLSPLAQLGSCCYTGAVLLTSSSPSRRLRPSQEAARRRAGKALPFVLYGPPLALHLKTGKPDVNYCLGKASQHLVTTAFLFCFPSPHLLFNKRPPPAWFIQEGKQFEREHEHLQTSVATIWLD